MLADGGRRAARWPWSATPACPGSRTPGAGWWPPRPRPGSRVIGGPGPVGGAGRPGDQRAPHRPVLLRGIPAPFGPGPPQPAGAAGRRDADHRALRGARPGGGHLGRPGRVVRWRPAGGGGPGADQAARGGLAGHAGRGTDLGGRGQRCGARWCWWSRRAPPQDAPGSRMPRSLAALAARLDAGERTRGAVDDGGRPVRGSPPPGLRPGPRPSKTTGGGARRPECAADEGVE